MWRSSAKLGAAVLLWLSCPLTAVSGVYVLMDPGSDTEMDMAGRTRVEEDATAVVVGFGGSLGFEPPRPRGLWSVRRRLVDSGQDANEAREIASFACGRSEVFEFKGNRKAKGQAKARFKAGREKFGAEWGRQRGQGHARRRQQERGTFFASLQWLK